MFLASQRQEIAISSASTNKPIVGRIDRESERWEYVLSTRETGKRTV
jgi:hypothetical protein